MKKLIASLMIGASCLIGTAQANPVFNVENTFWSANEGNFEVRGYISGADGNPVCQLNGHYKDGSYFSLVKDIVDGELWMELHNKNWNTQGVEFKVIWNFHNRNGSVNFSQTANARITGPQTIQLRQLNNNGYTKEVETFLNLFKSSYAISFYEEDETNIFNMSLNGSRAAMNSVINCYAYAEKHK